MPLDFKIVLVGDYSVGKTTLLTQLIKKHFDQYANSTIGASFQVWNTPFKKNKNTYYTLGIWDTAGQERFSSLIPLYIRESDVVLYCWDYNKSFDWEYLENKYNNIKMLSPNCIFYLVLTKIDKSIDSIINNKRAAFFISSKKEGGLFYTSALTGEGVQQVFLDISKYLIDNKKSIKQPTIVLDNTNTNTNNKFRYYSRCCST